MFNKINGFFGEFRWLSNFYPSPIVDHNYLQFPTVEHAYQACKATTVDDRELIRNTVKPGDAKRLARQIKLRDDWEKVKFDIMEYYVRLKFQQNLELAKKLIETGDMYLCEKNNWNDQIWGVCNGIGNNCLGKILMKVRSEIQKPSF